MNIDRMAIRLIAAQCTESESRCQLEIAITPLRRVVVASSMT